MTQLGHIFLYSVFNTYCHTRKIMNTLESFGWNEHYNYTPQPGMVPARVVADFGTSLTIATPTSIKAELSGKLAHYTDKDLMPKIGDWVYVSISDNGNAIIETIIPRRNEIARKVAGKQVRKQIIAANIDTAFVLLALDNDFSVERLKRFLYQLSISNVEAIIVLNKADAADDIDTYTAQLEELSLPIIITSALTGQGVDTLITHIKPGKTAILLGSSGVGKSTLTNQLLGTAVQATQAVRLSDSTGKHTTVHRSLFILPNGGLLIDTPGIRELQLWGTDDDLNTNFEDIKELASQCKYTSCRHGVEEGCVIRESLRNGTLSSSHYASYQKMQKELIVLQEKIGAQARHKKRMSKADAKLHKNETSRQIRDELDS